MSVLGDAALIAFGATTDASRAARFYADMLGLRTRSDDAFALVLDANGVELRLQKVASLTPQPFTMLGWKVGDLVSAIDALVARGVRFERFPGMTQDARAAWDAPSGARVAWFRDPDGNLLSLTQHPGA